MSIFIALDLEMNQPSNKIIQVGLSRYDTRADMFVGKCININPKEIIHPFITGLTGIKQSHVDKQDTISPQLRKQKLKSFFKGCYPQIITWGNGDLNLLNEQFSEDSELDTTFSSYTSTYLRYINVKMVYQMWAISNNRSPFCGLKNAMKHLGLDFEGTPHNAHDDAYNTLRVFLLLKRKLNGFLTENVKPKCGKVLNLREFNSSIHKDINFKLYERDQTKDVLGFSLKGEDYLFFDLGGEDITLDRFIMMENHIEQIELHIIYSFLDKYVNVSTITICISDDTYKTFKGILDETN